MTSELPESTIRLLAAADWWIRLLTTVAERMGSSVDDFGTQRFFESNPTDELAQYFPLEEIEAEVGKRDPDLVSRELQADALFVAGALYQVKAMLDRLARLDLWRGSLASTGNVYRQIYKDNGLQNLRNVIEHADEHIALDKRSIASDFDMGIGIKTYGRAGGRGIGPAVIHLWGEEYEVLSAIEAARNVAQHLDYEIPESMLRQPPIPEPADYSNNG